MVEVCAAVVVTLEMAVSAMVEPLFMVVTGLTEVVTLVRAAAVVAVVELVVTVETAVVRIGLEVSPHPANKRLNGTLKAIIRQLQLLRKLLAGGCLWRTSGLLCF